MLTDGDHAAYLCVRRTAGIVAGRPGFGDYEAKTTRVMPVVRLRRAA